MATSRLPADHLQRWDRARRSLEGLSVGDAFGEQFFYTPEWIASRTLPPPRWPYTDDTAMALGIVDVLARRGRVDEDELARVFAENYNTEPHRGYGSNAHRVLRAVADGADWRRMSESSFGGSGSMGNGAAMRVAPLGAYFADDLDAVVEQAAASARPTHMHPEGQAGAVAVAAAAAVMWQNRDRRPQQAVERMFAEVLACTPPGETREAVARAADLPLDRSVDEAVGRLGNGSRITSPDTVPFCLWCAARHADDFAEALWTTVRGLGDRDTTCAIVGGIVALSAKTGIPEEFSRSREPLPPITIT